MLDENTERNIAIRAIFLELQKDCFFFSFRATLFFPLMNALV